MSIALTLRAAIEPRADRTATVRGTAAFLEALQTYRNKWPGDGYFDATPRFTETFRLFEQFYDGGTILDVGGWPGDFSSTLALMGLDVVLLDRDLSRVTTKVKEATGHYVACGDTTLIEKCHEYGVATVQCDVEHESIPLADGSVDFAVFTEVVEHLRREPLFALRELRRVLRPSGRLLVTTPNLLSLRNRLSFLTGRIDYDTLEMPYDAVAAEERIGHPGHFRVFSMPEVVDLFVRSGFRVLYSGYRHILPAAGTREPWSLFLARIRLMNGVARFVKPLGNTLFLVLARNETLSTRL